MTGLDRTVQELQALLPGGQLYVSSAGGLAYMARLERYGCAPCLAVGQGLAEVLEDIVRQAHELGGLTRG